MDVIAEVRHSLNTPELFCVVLIVKGCTTTIFLSDCIVKCEKLANKINLATGKPPVEVSNL